MDSIMPVSNRPYLKSDLQEKLSSYAPSLTVLAKGLGQTEDDLTDLVKQIYYENPMDIVMLPIPQASSFSRITVPTRSCSSHSFTDTNPARSQPWLKTLKGMYSVSPASVPGSSDGEILLRLCQRLMDITEYDVKKGKSGDYSNQSIEATAYGALENHSAVGEGYARAYKALCDVLGIECYVVLGERNNVPQAWNIVRLEGYYYHIDVSMCDVNGIATAFLKNDADMRKTYTWDSSKYKPCYGPMTYQSLLSTLPSPSTSASPSGSPSASPSGSASPSPSGGIHTT